VCGRGSLRVTMIPERQYQLLRRRADAQRPEPSPPNAGGTLVPPARVGRLRTKDSVLVAGGSPGEWLLRVDRAHAVLFDHATDHLPLMVLLEGFRQLGHLLVNDGDTTGTQWVLAALSAECYAWAELDEPTCLVVREDSGDADPTAARRLVVDAVQRDSVALAGRMMWHPLSHDPAHAARSLSSTLV
jgi:hypothetical protein